MSGPDIEAVKTLDPNAVFSILETAKILGMTHNGVLTRIKRGQLRFGKSGSRYFVSGADIQKQVQLPGTIDV